MNLIPSQKQCAEAISRPDAFKRYGIAEAAIKKLMADKKFWAEDRRARLEHLNAPSVTLAIFRGDSR